MFYAMVTMRDTAKHVDENVGGPNYYICRTGVSPSVDNFRNSL